MGETKHAYKILMGKSERKRPLLRHGWEDNIKTDLNRILKIIGRRTGGKEDRECGNSKRER